MGSSHLAQPSQVLLEPRKSPVQARSAASVEAILEATVQVLLAVGKERLTTTRVAMRAGVSVGTLYQYFPNKSSLLQAALRRHFDDIRAAVEQVCESERGKPLAEMGAALAGAFLAAKLKDEQTSVALYAVGSDLDGVEIAQGMKRDTHEAICGLFGTASDGPCEELALVTTMVQGLLAGISRQLVESDAPRRNFEPFRRELIRVVQAYLEGCPRRAASERSRG